MNSKCNLCGGSLGTAYHECPVAKVTLKKPYILFKNHLHNTLGISKDDIRGMVDKAVTKIVERKIEVMMDGRELSKESIQRLVDDAINEKLNKNHWFWGHQEEKLDDYIKNQVVKKLLDGVKLEVSLKTPKSRKPAPPNLPNKEKE